MMIYRRVLRYLRPYWHKLVASMLCSVMFSLASGMSIYLTIPLLETLFFKPSGSTAAPTAVPSAVSPAASILPDWLAGLKDRAAQMFQELVFRDNPADSLLNICIVVVVAFFLRNIFGYLQSNLMIAVEQGLIRDLRNDLYRHIHALPLAYFTNERTGNLISRIMNDVPVINTGISATFQTLIREPLLIIVYLTITLMISWKLTIIAFVVFPLALLVITGIGRRVHKESGFVQERIADLTSVLHETISGVKVVKAFGMEQFENRKFAQEGQRYLDTILRVTRIRNLASPSTEFLSAAAGAVIIWYGGMQVLQEGTLKASEFLGFLFAMFQLMPPIKELSGVNNRIQEATAAGKRVFEILDTEPGITDPPVPVPLHEFSSSIDFDNVEFHYVEGDPVLVDVSLTIRKGEVIAIVGPSGAGKSTLVDLVPRFYDPTAGSITIDGVDLRNLELKTLRDMIGIVTQETILFNDTVRNNIAYGLDNCSMDRVVEAARAANAHNFISEMPDGYESRIGERGVKISGGERQRLALARAILKNPPILILDEATSALDTESEILVQEAIERLMAGRTSIVIAHRLSTVQHADRIIVIEGGRVVESGKHADLVKKRGGLYKKLFDMQFRI
ncbi:MAG TPA: ABC transporter ATP-binding protein [Bacteroidota bacterium]|nr:ABC transporter ATP-binding protein [Bacteroidota bacterium]